MYKPLIWSGTVVMVILSIFLLVSTSKVWNTATTTNTVSFSGEGKVTAKPDIAKIQLSIVTEALTSKAAQDDNSKKSKAITDYLQKQGLGDKDIKTTGYNINRQYSTRPCLASDSYPCFIQKQVISGYHVNQSLEIKIRNLDNASNILDGVVATGANQVNELSFEIDNPDVLKTEARAKAIADAKNKANELESQVGISLGKIVNFSENTGGYPGPIYLQGKAMGLEGGSGPSIPTGESEIVVNVSLTYQIK